MTSPPPLRSRRLHRLLRPKFLVAGTGVVLALFMLLIPSPYGITHETMRAGAVVVLSLSLWASSTIPEDLTAILFFLLAMLLAIAPAEVVFSGFHSTALWLVFGGVVIGAAVTRTGLGVRITRGLVGWLEGSYARIVTGAALVSVLMALLIPSTMSRVVLLVPMMTALADQLGFKPGSRGRTGIVLTAVVGTYFGSCGILPSNVPNVILAGIAETQFGFQLTYGRYMLLLFPVLSLFKVALLVPVICWMFSGAGEGRGHVELPSDHASAEQRRLGIVLGIALLLWASDAWHGISPAWIALGAALVCLFPAVGLVPLDEFNQRVNLRSVFYVAGILGLGAVVASSGIGDLLSSRLIALSGFEPGQPAWNIGAHAAIGTVLGTVATMPGMTAIITPFAGQIAEASGLPLETALVGAAMGFSNVLFPYQVPPLVVGAGMAGESLADVTKLLFVMALLTVFVVLPLNYCWWWLLGAL